MTCDDCHALINCWLDYRVKYRGWIDYRATVQGRTGRALDNYRMRAEQHWTLVRTQIEAIEQDCNHELNGGT